MCCFIAHLVSHASHMLRFCARVAIKHHVSLGRHILSEKKGPACVGDILIILYSTEMLLFEAYL